MMKRLDAGNGMDIKDGMAIQKDIDLPNNQDIQNKKNIRNILTLILCGSLFFGLSAFSWIKAPQSYSNSERRALAQLPKISATTLQSGRFMKDFENYATDQFPMRDGFRTFKAYTAKNILQQKDNHGIYTVDGYLSQLEYPLNENKVKRHIQQINQVYKTYLADSKCKTSLALIPDKNYFLAPIGGYPSLDYDHLVDMVRENVPHDQYIHIFDLLSLDDYYKTDQHWRQECVVDVAERIGQQLHDNWADRGSDSKDKEEPGNQLITKPDPMEYLDNILDHPFYGAYVGQSALSFPADTLHFLTNETLDQCKVTSYRNGTAQESSIYNMGKAYGRDPYDIFLGGADPLIVIENPAATNEKELVIFRDSFGSSLAPLLVPYYKKITLVDLRYMQSNLLGNYISFDGQDVLFLYSTLILNH